MTTSTARLQLANYLNGTGFNNRNYCKNPSAHVNTTDNIVLGAGVTSSDVTRNTSSPLTAISDFQISFNSATNEYVEWSLGTLDRADQNGNCEFSGSYKLSLGSGATVQAQIYQGGVLAASLDLVAEAASRRFSLNVPCGTAATTVRFAQTVSTNTSTLNVAGLYYGRASNIGTVAQSELYGTARGYTASSCNWTHSSTSFQTFPVDSDCSLGTVTGKLSQPATKIPAFRMLNAPPGKYVVTAVFQGATSTGNGSWRLYDGTTETSNIQTVNSSNLPSQITLTGVFEYTTSGDRTIEVQARAGGGDIQLTANSAFLDLTFTVQRYPTQSEIAYNPATAFPTSTADYQNASNCAWTYSTTSIGTFSADADCATPVLTGAATAPGTKIPGITFAKLPAGSYQVNITGSWQASTNGCIYGIYDGTTYKGQSYMQAGSNGATKSAIFTYASEQSNITFQPAVKAESGATCTLNHSTGGVYGTDDNHLRIEVIPISQASPAPILVGSVTSGSTGAERLERAHITNNGTTATIANQSGTWLSSVNRTATGKVTLNFASGIFASAPYCWGTSRGNSVDGHSVVINENLTVSSATMSVITGSNSGNVDESFNFFCMGPRA